MKHRMWGTAFVVLAILCTACVSVDETEWCVKTRYGQVIEEGLQPGLTPLGFVSDATCFDLTERTLPREGVEIVEAQTADPLTVFGDVTVKVVLDRANMSRVFREKRTEDAIDRDIQDAVRSGYRDAIAGWTLNEIFSSRREALADSIQLKIQNKLGDMARVVEVFVRDIKAPPQIEAARIAAAEQENRFVEAQRRSQIDSINSSVDIMQARAEAEAKRLEAQAYASNPALLQLRSAEALAQGLAQACQGVQTCILGGDVMQKFLAGVGGGR